MSNKLTPAAERLKKGLAIFSGPLAGLTDEDYNWLARRVLDMPDRDRTTDEKVHEALLADALKVEWRGYMTASDEAWLEKARAMIARIKG